MFRSSEKITTIKSTVHVLRRYFTQIAATFVLFL